MRLAHVHACCPNPFNIFQTLTECISSYEPACALLPCCCACACRWELELVAPGEPTPLSGPRHQAILSAFEQYSLAVEDIAEDAEAAAAKVVSTRAPGGGGGTASGSGGSAIPGCSLGQILRARFDSLMSTPVGNDGDSNSISNRSTTKAEAAKQEQGELVVGDQREQKDQSAQQQQQQEEDEGSKGGSDASQPSSISNVAAWLASDGSGLLKRSFAEGWGCRYEMLVGWSAV